MAARKVQRAPMPPPLQQQPQQQLQTEEILGMMSFSVENSSDGDSSDRGAAAASQAGEFVGVQLRNPRQASGQSAGRLYNRSIVTDRPAQPQVQQQQQQQQQAQQQPQTARLKRTAYIPSKAPPPPPPPAQQQKQQQQPQTTAEISPTATSPNTIVHQTVYTRAKDPASSRLTNLFAPTPRPASAYPQQSKRQQWTGSNGNLSRRSFGSRSSHNGFAGDHESKRRSSGGFALKGRLTNLFRSKSRKPLPEQQQQQWEEQPQMQQQQQRQRRHSGGAALSMPQQPQPQQQQQQLASRKNLHTFTYTDAKIYNSNNAMHIPNAGRSVPPSSPQSKGPAPQPPGGAGNASPEAGDAEGRTQVWWNMRTMGATHSAYTPNVLLMRNADPVPDYETETTQF